MQLGGLAAAIWQLGLPLDAEQQDIVGVLTRRLLDDTSYAARRAAAAILPTLPQICADQVALLAVTGTAECSACACRASCAEQQSSSVLHALPALAQPVLRDKP